MDNNLIDKIKTDIKYAITIDDKEYLKHISNSYIELLEKQSFTNINSSIPAEIKGVYLIEKDITFFDVSSDWQLLKGRIIKVGSNCFLSSKLYDRSCSFNQLNVFETDIIISLIKANSNFIRNITNI